MDLEQIFERYENGNALAVQKDGVAIFCHPADRGAAEGLVGDIFAVYDCTVFLSRCAEDAVSAEALEAALSQMSLVVFAISARFLGEQNGARDLALRAAAGQRILPILLEPGLEEWFDRVVGPYELIDRSREDYIPRMKEFVDQRVSVYYMVGLSAEQEAVRQHLFRAKGFISYRKKDWLLRDRLMKALRAQPRFRDIALWYDASLYPGEDYNLQIQQQLSDADFALFIVTPSLLEPGNYVLEREYVQAVEERKIMAAVVMEDVPEEEFRRAYPALEPVPFADWAGALEGVLRRCCGAFEPLSPMKAYFLAMAYENGEGTARDIPLAYALYDEAARAGDPCAMKKLSEACAMGLVFPKDPQGERDWRLRALKAFHAQMRGLPAGDAQLYGVGTSVFTLAEQELLDVTDGFAVPMDEDVIRNAGVLLRVMQEALDRSFNEIGHQSGRCNYGRLYLRRGQLQLAAGNPEGAQKDVPRAAEGLDAVAGVVGENAYIRQNRMELSELSVGAAFWELASTAPGIGSGFVFANGIVPQGLWGGVNGNYIGSSCRCPRCGGRLYRTVFPQGREPRLFLRQLPGQYIDPARVFVCPCGCFYAAPRGKRLTDGEIAYAIVMPDPQNPVDQRRFEHWLNYFNRRGDRFATRDE